MGGIQVTMQTSIPRYVKVVLAVCDNGANSFVALRRSADNIIDLVSLMGKDSKMPCYSSGAVNTTNYLRQRFQLQLSADEAERFVETDLIAKSLGSYYTRL